MLPIYICNFTKISVFTHYRCKPHYRLFTKSLRIENFRTDVYLPVNFKISCHLPFVSV